MCLLTLLGLTDVLDGRLARHATSGHGLGAILDVAADMLLALSVALLLCFKGMMALQLPVFMGLASISYYLVRLANHAAIRTWLPRPPQ